MQDSTHVFIRVAIQELVNPKDGSKATEEMRLACDEAIQYLPTNNHTPDYFQKVFRPFLIACNQKHTPSLLLSLDCLAKLFDYNFWNQDGSDQEGLIGLIVETISSSFVGEYTDERTQMLVIKALSAAISVGDIKTALHGGLLLKAVRIIYNIFLISKSATIQTVAQATLTQISNTVFNRIPMQYDFRDIMKNHSDKLQSAKIKGDKSRMLADTVDDGEAFDAKLKLSDLETADPVTRNSQDILRDASAVAHNETDVDKVIKDAYLIFRAFCKLSMKAISGPESVTDLKSQAMRSKLLSLSLVNIILRTHGRVFSFPSPILFTSNVQATKPSDVAFVVAVRQYICLVFTRNIVSIVPQVFDLSMDIFGKMLLDLRFLLKKELSVIFTQIIIPIIEASNPVTFYQRVSIMKCLQRIFSDPNGGKVLVELYLNYDCDMSTGPDENIWERLMNALAQVMTSTFTDTGDNPQFDFKQKSRDEMNITTNNLVNYTKEQVRQLYLPNGDGNELKTRCLELLVRGVLDSLTKWCKDRAKRIETPTKVLEPETDDPAQFEMSKNKKVRLAEGIKMFNMKPKKAIKFLIDGRIIPSKTPRHVAHFLLNCPGLDKIMIGEYLGEGDEINVQTMHAFVDYMDFTGKSFVEALRYLLSTFRLPGEAQKIDRFMLKFAERYVNNNPNAFSSADTAYVLAYSVIMLNTDQYNPQVKKRMTCEDFVKNNRGIDEGKDLQVEFLEGIFNEIKENEIKMKNDQVNVDVEEGATSKHQTKSVRGSNNRARGDSLINAIKKNNGSTRDPTIMDAQFNVYECSTFIEATNYAHVKPMFQLNWMSFLMSVSSFLQNSQDLDAIFISLEGFKHSIYISCLFELELEKKGFFSNLSKFLELPNLLDIKEKNIEACKTVLEIAYENGNSLGQNWNAVVKMVSQLEKLHSRGMIEPDPTRSSDQRKKDAKHIEQMYFQVASQAVTLSVDRLFTSSTKLSGPAICEFAKGLCEMSWDEIISTSDREHPRMYCLQRLIEISHYNISTRIRIEWNQIWQTIGPHFNQVGCHSNPNVVYFCLDKLRQLASKFLELEELTNFKFQKEFLKPFLFIFENNPDSKIKDMVLVCINHMIQYKPVKIKSGWKAIFSILKAAASEGTEAIVKLGFKISNSINTDYLDLVHNQGFYNDLVATLTAYCHCIKFPKINAQAVAVLKQGVERVSNRNSANQHAHMSEKAKEEEQDEDTKLWMITLQNMKNVILSGELEIRSKALSDIFDLLFNNGSQFSKKFWYQILDEIIYPLFEELKKDPQERDHREDTAVWISTTLVTALKLLVDLYTTFQILIQMSLDRLLDLIMLCIVQENDTLSRLGAKCIQDFVERNVDCFSLEVWDKVCARIVDLFEVTMPKDLWFDVEDETVRRTPFDMPFSKKPTKKDFPKIIVKCVLHLNAIQTLHKLLSSSKQDIIFSSLDRRHIFTLGDLLYKSFIFAKMFNEDMGLRTCLMKMGFMKTLPNLVKQETTAATAYLHLLSQVFQSASPNAVLLLAEIEKRMIPLYLKILQMFVELDVETQQSLVSAWNPVVECIIHGFSDLPEAYFDDHLPYFYLLFVRLLRYGFGSSLYPIFERVGTIYHIPKHNTSRYIETTLFPSLESLANEMDVDELAGQLVMASLKGSLESLIDKNPDPFAS